MAKKKVPTKAAKGQKGGKESARPNPFELKGTKRKFDVVGRRDKDGKKNVIQSREAAVAKVCGAPSAAAPARRESSA